MRRISLTLILLLAACCAGKAQKQDWLPVTQQDWNTKEVPGDPVAAAIHLYYAEDINDPNNSRFVYHRVKVLNEKALQPTGPADVEILVPPDCSVSDLKARTLHPDGSIVEFTGKPFQKVVVKGLGFKFVAKTFTFPEATVGSILEYKYVLNTPANTIFLISEWDIQHDLFTVQESLTMKPYLQGLQGFMRGYQVSAVSTNLPKDVKFERKAGGWELHARNLQAFPKEPYMPPENFYKPQVRFFYINYQPDSDDRYWHDLGKALYDESERFIGSRGEVKQAALEAVGGEATPEGKLRKLYTRAQQIRNLTFERERTEQELKKEELKPNENAADVVIHGYGSHNEISRLFVAMAHAAGFDATLLEASNRKQGFFTKSLLSRSQVESEIVAVNLNGRAIYLDPGTKFCPFGLLPWQQTSTQALKLDKKGSELVLVPSATQDKAMMQRVANVNLSDDGTLKGEVAIQYTGSEALERRLDALKTDEAGAKKMLEDELKQSLPPGAVVKLSQAQGWEGRDEPLSATFSVDVPSYASLAGKRLLVPAFLFQTRQISTFKQSERRFPVYFPFAFAELDKVAINIPGGYTAESVPEQQEAGLPYAKYQIRSQIKASQLITERNLLLNGVFFPLERYPELRGFFSKVQVGDELQAVMQGGSTHAQN